MDVCLFFLFFLLFSFPRGETVFELHLRLISSIYYLPSSLHCIQIHETYEIRWEYPSSLQVNYLLIPTEIN